MSYRQLRKPDTGVRDYAGSCLRMTRIIYGVGARWYTAWEAWDATKHYSRSRSLPNISVPVWFDWTGYVPGHGRKRFGHVAAWIPGRGILSSPMSGHGQKWYPSIAALEKDMSRATGSPVVFVGWSLDINGVLVAEKHSGPSKPSGTPTLSPEGGKKMMMIHRNIKGKQTYAIFGAGFWMEFTGSETAGRLLAQLTGTKDSHSVPVSASFWNHCKKASGK